MSECVGRRSATAGRTPTQNAHVGPTQFTPLHQTRQDCRACLSTAAATTQARQAATLSLHTAHTQRRCTPRVCKHAVDCCTGLNLNLFTKRQATRVIYLLTVQTARRSRDSSHCLIRHRQHCLVCSGGGCELGLNRRFKLTEHGATGPEPFLLGPSFSWMAR